MAIDSYVDERRDPEKATRAAAKYLLDLYKQFGSWYLAAASYNCGEGRVQRELNQSNHKNFWELSANMCLPTETKNYVPQMIAATIIAKNPEKFGFKNVPYLPPAKYDKVPVTEPTSLTATAVAVNVPIEEVAALNPELLRGVTPPDVQSYTLNLPANSKEQFTKNITIARIEHPAVASHPIRTARSSGQSYASGKKSSSRQASVAAKSNGKKAASQTYAKQEKPTHSTPAKAGAAPVVQASLFGTPSPASKPGDAKKTKTALIGTPKNQTKAPAAKSKKAGEAPLAKKSDNSAKSVSKAKKNGSSSKNSKDKYSRSKSTQALMVSEAR
jgi:membrane-bound lytic murein transglycosylase D